MTRYRETFDRLAQRSEGALCPFIMLGAPSLHKSAELLDALVAGGADMIEVGLPFSDPVADGPVIQAAAKRGLANRVRVDDCFAVIRAFRDRHRNVPLGILTYANIVFSRGRERFFTDAAAAGADSLLIADLPAREAEPWANEMAAAGIDPVLVAAASTPPETIEKIARLSSAYVYCVTRAGITGVHSQAAFDAGLLERLREQAAAPAMFGFGIYTPAHVRGALDAGAAGAISGSAVVSLIADTPDPVPAVCNFVASLKAATLPRR